MAIQLQLHLEGESFEGPLELLLTLIEQRRLPITRVSLAEVADQYMAQLHAMPELNRDILADFLTIGGRLLLLKSRALLVSEEPDVEVDEVATDLTERLATYRIFRTASEYLRELELRDARTYPTAREPRLTAEPGPLAPIAPQELAGVWRRLLAPTPPPSTELPLLVRASVEARRVLILDALRAQDRVSFRALAGETLDQVVATFLAVLELFRRKQIQVTQPEPFGDILLERPPITPQPS